MRFSIFFYVPLWFNFCFEFEGKAKKKEENVDEEDDVKENGVKEAKGAAAKKKGKKGI